MKTPALLLALLLPAAASAEIQFNGVVIDSNGKTKVSLINTDTLDSHWVAINGKFGGYTVVEYKPGRPVNPTNPKDTGVKDTVVLALPSGGRTSVIIADAVLVPATTFVSVAGAQPTNAVATLTARLADEMAKPNPNPELIQALQQTIARQSQQTAAGITATGTGTINITPGQPAQAGGIQVQTNVVNGQTTRTITVNGQSTVETQIQNLNDSIRTTREAAPVQPDPSLR